MGEGGVYMERGSRGRGCMCLLTDRLTWSDTCNMRYQLLNVVVQAGWTYSGFVKLFHSFVFLFITLFVAKQVIKGKTNI